MKRVITLLMAALLLSCSASMVYAKDGDKAPKVKPKLALMIQGKVTKEILPTSQKEIPAVGTDYTFEWSGGKGDIIIAE